MFFKSEAKREYLKAKKRYEDALKKQDWSSLNDIEFDLIAAEKKLIEWAFTRCEKNHLNLDCYKDNWAANGKTLVGIALNMR